MLIYSTYGILPALNRIYMNHKLTLIISAVVLFASCSNEKPDKSIAPPNFTTYEVSYNGELNGTLSFYVDSTRVFLATMKFQDTLYFGILPDSIIATINKSVYEILNDSSLARQGPKCYDCSSISILMTIGKDTIRHLQKTTQLSDRFYPMIDAILEHIRSGNSNKKFSPLVWFSLFETTRSQLTPLPPKRADLPKH
jgi:hypothetical protein